MKKLYLIKYIEYRQKKGHHRRFRPRPNEAPTKVDLLWHYTRFTPVGKTRTMIVAVSRGESAEGVFKRHKFRGLFESRTARVIVGIEPLDYSDEIIKMTAQEVVV